MYFHITELPCMTTLAQQSGASGKLLGLYVIMGVFILLVIVLAIVISSLRKKWLGEQASEASADPFSISDLRRMYREGQLTDEEFEKAKAQIVAMHTGIYEDRDAEPCVEKPVDDTDNQQ